MAGNRDPAGHDQGPDEPAPVTVGLTPAGKAWSLAVAAALVVWFLIAWLMLDRHVLDAAGESVGVAFLLGIVISLIGAWRGSHRIDHGE